MREFFIILRLQTETELDDDDLCEELEDIVDAAFPQSNCKLGRVLLDSVEEKV